MNDARKALIAACSTMGIDIENRIELTLEKATELVRVLKEEYDIEVHIKQVDEFEKLKTSMDYLVFEDKPALEFCSTPPDGRAKRRERRKQERLARKKNRL